MLYCILPSNGLTFKSWKSPTSSQLRINLVGVGVSSAILNYKKHINGKQEIGYNIIRHKVMEHR